MLMSITLLDADNDLAVQAFCYTLILSGNMYFNAFEILQFLINGKNYFLSYANIMDVSRITLIYLFVYGAFDDEDIQRNFVLPAILILLWYRVISYLSVFKATRYLIKMI